jgi:hypothetical protein
MIKNKYHFRIAILIFVVVATIVTGWYCYYSYNKNKVPEDATLVQKEIFFYEGET